LVTFSLDLFFEFFFGGFSAVSLLVGSSRLVILSLVLFFERVSAVCGDFVSLLVTSATYSVTGLDNSQDATLLADNNAAFFRVVGV
jgi:hypothetical protein